MNKLLGLLTACLGMYMTASAQDSAATQTVAIARDTTLLMQPAKSDKPVPVYTINKAVDIPLTAVGTAWSLYAFSKIYSKDPSSAEKILSLRKSDINGFDRWAVRPYNKQTDKISYLPFYASMPLPIAFLFDHKMRKDFWKLSFMYLEAMSVTGLLYTGSVYTNDRYRPYVWDDRTDMEYRMRGGGKNSFYAGHVALVATSTFFWAQVWADYHPDSKAKWVWYTVAGAATGSMAYMRHRAGQHFPSDLLLGTLQGTLSGLFVPKLHKTKLFKSGHMSFVPYAGPSNGLAMLYRF